MKQYLNVFLTALLLCALICSSAFAVPYTDTELAEFTEEWESIKENDGLMTLTPGADETELNFCWLSDLDDNTPCLKISSKSDMSNAIDLSVKSTVTLYAKRSNTATATGLVSGTVCYYSYTIKNVWSEPAKYTSQSADSFSVIFVSDAQIGRSGDEKKDEVLIRDTLGFDCNISSAIKKVPDASFMISSGDQVESAYSLVQYNAFRSPDKLRSLPVAAAQGNHDFYFPMYGDCFNNPNEVNEILTSPAGDGYFFAYGDVLFIMMNSNNTLFFDQRALLEKAIETYPDARWRVVTMHHSIYSSENEEGEKQFMRGVFAPLFDAYGIDLVLSGHNHTYTRSFNLKNGETVKNGQGTVYLEASSASGSNYRSPDANPDTYVASAWQEREPTYSVLDFDADGITLNTYRCDTGEKIDDEFVIEPSEKSDDSISFITWIIDFFKYL